MPIPSSVRDSDYLEGMRGLSYPFKQYAADVSINRLFADLFFACAGELDDATPARVTGIDLSGTYGSEVMIMTVTVGGRTYVADDDEPGVTHTVSRTTGWITHSWRRSTASSPFYFSVTLDRPAYEAALLAGGIDEDALTLDLHDRCYSSQPLKVRVASVDGVALDIDKAVRLVAGTAIVLTAADASTANLAITAITVAMDPDASPGANANCSENVGVVRTFNGIQPDEYGNFVLLADSCHWITDLGASSNPTTNQLAIHNNCVPCVDCDLVFEAYERLSDVRDLAGGNRLRTCDLVTVFNDYAQLASLVGDELKKFKIESEFEQTDYESYAVIFRLHVGPKAIKFVRITVTYDGVVESAYQAYSGREKVFGYASRQKLNVTSTTTNPNTGAAFDGTVLEYDATGAINHTALRESTHASWHWNMYLRDNTGIFGTEIDVDITWRMEITFYDNTTYDTGDVTETVTIISQNGGSD